MEDLDSERSRKLKLFVCSRGAASQRAMAAVRDLCENELDSPCDLEVIDVLESPEQARSLGIIALPVLIREEPAPARRLVGDFTDHGRVAAALGMLRARRRAVGSAATDRA